MSHVSLDYANSGASHASIMQAQEGQSAEPAVASRGVVNVRGFGGKPSDVEQRHEGDLDAADQV